MSRTQHTAGLKKRWYCQGIETVSGRLPASRRMLNVGASSTIGNLFLPDMWLNFPVATQGQGFSDRGKCPPD
jgi:hypothetical protein